MTEDFLDNQRLNLRWSADQGVSCFAHPRKLSRPPRRHRRGSYLFLLFIAAIPLVGRARPVGTIFPEIKPVIIWPPPPDTSRIRYAGQLSTDTDLKPALSGWEVFTQKFGGLVSAHGISTLSGLA